MCRLHVVRWTVGTLVGALLGIACSDSSNGSSGQAGFVPPGGFGEDAGVPSASDAQGSSGPTTTFRLAHLSPDLPGIDFCYRSAASDTWIGPVLGASAADAGGQPDASIARDATFADVSADGPSVDASANDAGASAGDAAAPDAAQVEDASNDAWSSDAMAAADASVPADASKDSGSAAGDASIVADSGGSTPPPDAGAGGDGGGSTGALSYRDVTGYASTLGSGTFDIALIAAGSAGCTTAIAIAQVTLDAGKRTTIAIVGRTSVDAGTDGALAIVALTDDPGASTSGARVRFVNAALGSATQTAPGALIASFAADNTSAASISVAADVEPAHAATPTALSPVIDALGYHDTPSTGAVAIVLDRVDRAWPSPWTSATTDLALRTGSIHTAFVVSGAASPLAVVWCDDTNATGALTACATIESTR